MISSIAKSTRQQNHYSLLVELKMERALGEAINQNIKIINAHVL